MLYRACVRDIPEILESIVRILAVATAI